MSFSTVFVKILSCLILAAWFCSIGCHRQPRSNESVDFRPAIDPLGKITSGHVRLPSNASQTYLAWQAEHENLVQAIQEQNQSGIFQAHFRISGHLKSLYEDHGWYLAKTYHSEYQTLWQQAREMASPRMLLRKYEQLKNRVEDSWRMMIQKQPK